MKQVTEQDRRDIWAEVRREFPEDEMMQEIHYVRRLHRLQTEGMSDEELITFYEAALDAIPTRREF